MEIEPLQPPKNYRLLLEGEKIPPNSLVYFEGKWYPGTYCKPGTIWLAATYYPRVVKIRKKA